MTSLPIPNAPSLSISPDDVELEVTKLFGDPASSGLVIRVHGAEMAGEARTDAFKELLESLSIYSDQFRDTSEIEIEPPDKASIHQGLMVLADQRLQENLFRRILLTLGKEIVDPLGAILSTTPEGTLFNRIDIIRQRLGDQIKRLKLSYETRAIILGDLDKLLSDDYLQMLIEHEEQVQRPHAEALAQQILHLIGSTLQRAFDKWPNHAERISIWATRGLAGQVAIRENPMVIRQRIVEGIENYLWVETSNEINGMLHQLFSQKQYRGLLEPPYPRLTRAVYKDLAMTCWDLVAESC